MFPWGGKNDRQVKFKSVGLSESGLSRKEFDTIANLQSMTKTSNETNKLAKSVGLDIVNVSWEDSARNKNSTTGPHICDMTLNIGKYPMPVLRESNFEDKTWDLDINKIPIVVGNEKQNNKKLKTISLKEFLMNIGKYMNNSKYTKKHKLNLLRKNNRDKLILVSSQACFLPIKSDEETRFNIKLYNNNANKNNPSCLVIVSMINGTSVSVIDRKPIQLYFNENGTNSLFVAERLSHNRKKHSRNSNSEVSAKEKQECIIRIIQIPLALNLECLITKVNNNTSFTIHCTTNFTISQIKHKIFEKWKIDIKLQRLYVNERELRNNALMIADYCGNNTSPHIKLYYSTWEGSGNMIFTVIKYDNKIVNSNVILKVSSKNSINDIIKQLRDKFLENKAIASYEFFVYADTNNPIKKTRICNDFNKSLKYLDLNCTFKYEIKLHSKPSMFQFESIYSYLFPIIGGTVGIGVVGAAVTGAIGTLGLYGKDDNIEHAIIQTKKMTTPQCKFCNKFTKLVLLNPKSKDYFCLNCNKLMYANERSYLCDCSNDYLLCISCGKDKLKYKEMNGYNKLIKRDERYPIRITQQYYKATDNGIAKLNTLKSIKKELKENTALRQWGSLITNSNTNRTTDWLNSNFIKIEDEKENYLNDNNIFDDNTSNSGDSNISNNNINNNNLDFDPYLDIEKGLKSLKLIKYFSQFEAEEIDDECLLDMEIEDVKHIITVTGHRIKFRKWLKKYQQQNM